MAKQLIFAVAGSGKTTKILDSISDDQRSLIITYTTENLRSLESSLIERYGCVPEFVSLQSYFSFLYKFCFRPVFSYKLRDNSYTWDTPHTFPTKNKTGHYITKNRYLYANRVAKFIVEKGAVGTVVARLEKYFDNVFVDEVQDFAANDFNLLLELVKADIDMLFVGDFYQHTFDTSRDGNIRTSLHKKGAESYLKEFEKAGVEIDIKTLNKTHRCSPTVCKFITDQIGIPIESIREDETNVVIVDEKDQALELCRDDTKVKLFYQNSAKYDCYSNNWGKCKGLNKYVDVCVVLNLKTSKLFREGKLSELADSTKNKLYVACSRANRSLYILDESHLSEFKTL
jgi:DNA helicase-2/ATP-dependent DNA helicase PcrA